MSGHLCFSLSRRFWVIHALFAEQRIPMRFGSSHAGKTLPCSPIGAVRQRRRARFWILLTGADDPLTQSDSRGFGPIRDLKLGADVVDVIADRIMTDLKNPGDLLVGEPF